MIDIRSVIFNTLKNYKIIKHNTEEAEILQQFEKFLTYTIVKANDADYYDNDSDTNEFEGTINLYSALDDDMYAEITKIKELLQDAGFTIVAYGYDIPVDDLEYYDGLGLHYHYKKRY